MVAIEDFFRIYQDSAWSKDAAAMISLYDEEAVVFDMWDQGYVSVSSEWGENIEDWLGSLGEEKVKVAFEMVKIKQSDTIGFASALIQFQAVSAEGIVLRGHEKQDDTRICKAW